MPAPDSPCVEIDYEISEYLLHVGFIFSVRSSFSFKMVLVFVQADKKFCQNSIAP